MTSIADIGSRNGLPRQLSREKCREWVKELYEQGGRITYRDHAFEKMEGRDITDAQVRQVLKRGDIIDGPTWSTKYDNWEFLMKADTAGDEVRVKAAIEIEQLMGEVIAVITVF